MQHSINKTEDAARWGSSNCSSLLEDNDQKRIKYKTVHNIHSIHTPQKQQHQHQQQMQLDCAFQAATRLQTEDAAALRERRSRLAKAQTQES